MPDPKAISRLERRRARDIKKETCMEFFESLRYMPSLSSTWQSLPL